MTEKKDPFDVDALERSLNDAGTRVLAIWLGYLIFTLSLFITAIVTVTHRQLFLDEPLKLPVLNIDLTLFWFSLSPILLVLLQFYLLLQVFLLSRTASAYNDTVDRTVKSPTSNALVRQRLANTLFGQLFACPLRDREGWLGRVLKLMTWITLILFPLCVVFAFQFSFLPYHSRPATSTHRVLIFVELAFAFWLWRIFDVRRDLNRPKLIRQVMPVVAFVFACILVGVASVLLLSFPGEPQRNLFTDKLCETWISPGYQLRQIVPGRATPAVVDTLPQFDRLVLPRIDIAGTKLDERAERFRGRDFNCGNFMEANLRRADFADAQLQGADFVGAQLQGAVFRGAQLQGARLMFAQLQGARLMFAQLQGAALNAAQLQDADLGYARLQGALLDGAQLQHAHLNGAQLQHALLNRAQLQGAELSGTHLNGSVLINAQLEGAVLMGAQLQGARLDDAQLQGAVLNGAQVQSAVLDRAQLQGAALRGAQLQGTVLINALLQGADFGGAQLQGVDLRGSNLNLSRLSGAYLWRAYGANCSNARITGPRFDAVISDTSGLDETGLPHRRFQRAADDPSLAVERTEQLPLVSATPEALEKFIESVVAGFSNQQQKQKDAVRGILRQRLIAPIDLAEIETNWRDCANKSQKLAETMYRQQHAELLRDLVCNASTNRKEIATGIIDIWISDKQDDYSSLLARLLLGHDGCVAIEYLSDRTRDRLREFASTPKGRPPL
jgi:uncharacterized protein YjbI with pentapeptide repeats